jgi:hypothetical protein
MGQGGDGGSVHGSSREEEVVVVMVVVVVELLLLGGREHRTRLRVSSRTCGMAFGVVSATDTTADGITVIVEVGELGGSVQKLTLGCTVSFACPT